MRSGIRTQDRQREKLNLQGRIYLDLSNDAS
jgi:hypothetical protein